MNEYEIMLTWDEETQVWYCISDDIPGLILESGSLDLLVERARHAVPELLEIMGFNPANASLSFKAERRATVFT